MTTVWRRSRTFACAAMLVAALACSGVAHAQTAQAPGGEPLRDGLSVAPLTRLVAPIGLTGSGADTAWYAVLLVDPGVDPRRPLATLAAQAEQAGFVLAHRSDDTVELVGEASGTERRVRLGSVAAQGDVPAYVQVVVTSSPRGGP